MHTTLTITELANGITCSQKLTVSYDEMRRRHCGGEKRSWALRPALTPFLK